MGFIASTTGPEGPYSTSFYYLQVYAVAVWLQGAIFVTLPPHGESQTWAALPMDTQKSVGGAFLLFISYIKLSIQGIGSGAQWFSCASQHIADWWMKVHHVRH